MPSFDELRKKLSDNKTESEPNKPSGNAIVKVSKKDKTLIEIEADSLEDAYAEACNYFNTDKDHLKMKIKQKGSKGLLGVGKKRYVVYFKFYEDVGSIHDVPQDGYVKVHVRKDGVYVRVVQGINGGKMVTEEYVAKMLVERKIRGYDTAKIKESISSGAGKWIKVSDTIKSNIEWNSKAKIDVSKDKMSATLMMTPPILNGRIVEKDSIMDLLKAKNVKFGIMEEEIDKAVNECIYNHPVVVAEGKPPKHGENAKIDFKFKTHPENEIEFQEDQFGKVDYFNVIGLIQNVVEDQVLAVKVPATKGEPGRNVEGEAISARDGEDINLPAGKNTKVSDNGMEIISMMQGQAVYENDVVSVEPVYTVKGNVNLTSGGNIVFLGTVIVTGDVGDGFGVKATQNIEIGGTVGRCEIEAEGNIIIKGGIQGRSTLHLEEEEDKEKEPEGFVKAGKSIYAKFINGSIVKAENDIVVSDAIYHSKVTSGSRIICLGKKGRVIGGKLIATKEVNAKEIGSRNSYTHTEVEVGTDPEAKEKLITFETELRDKEEHVKKMKQNIDTLNKQRKQNKDVLTQDKEVMLQKLLLAINEHSSIVDEIKEDIAGLKAYLDDIKASGKVSIKEYVYPGVHIQIKEVSKKIERENQFVTYILEGGEIRDIQYQDVDKSIKEQFQKGMQKTNKNKKK